MQIIDLIYFDDYCEESAGSKRFLLKLKKIYIYIYIYTQQEKEFSVELNTDFTCDVLLYKKSDFFMLYPSCTVSPSIHQNKRS